MLDGLKMEENFQSAIDTSASFSSLLGRAVSPKSVCEGCQRVILDRFLLRLNDSFWHEQCVQCASCKEPLETTCFYRDKKLYCKYDYEKPKRHAQRAELPFSPVVYIASHGKVVGQRSARVRATVAGVPQKCARRLSSTVCSPTF
ncbi:LIM homeobox transcription factor 1-alpha-like [Trachypithecus francoisi]|uniref:LIM homeobox transcription factor 1-alpha-like n=1 Tax=Trachypithecus francoisi TaxID=54180 RepID=UPI00141AFE15|nr:LIM homeobox transcription factor 1-alpha-like [Trachypithecus francoisi]